MSLEEVDALIKLIGSNREPEVLQVLKDAGDRAREICCFPGSKGFTPLHMAAFCSHLPILLLILDTKVDVDLPLTCVVRKGLYWYERGSTALHIACSKRHSEVVEALLQHHADAGLSNGGMALQTPLHVAAEHGFIQNACLLIDKQVNIECLDHDQERPLHKAARHGHSAVVSLLNTHHAQVNCTNSSGKTPLHLAVAEGHLKTVVHLLENNADINLLDTEGNSALTLAVLSARDDIVPLLLDHGIDPSSQNSSGCTALHYASDLGQVGSVRMLLESMIKLDLVDHLGQTALHKAVKASHLDVVSELLMAKADTDIQDNEGHVARFYASQPSIHEVLEKGITPSVILRREKTILSLLLPTDDPRDTQEEDRAAAVPGAPNVVIKASSSAKDREIPGNDASFKKTVKFDKKNVLSKQSVMGLDKTSVDALRQRVSALESQILSLCLGDDAAAILFRRFGKLTDEMNLAKQAANEICNNLRPHSPILEDNKPQQRNKRTTRSSPTDLPSPRTSQKDTLRKFNPNFMVETMESLKSELHMIKAEVKPLHALKLERFIEQIESLAFTVVTFAHLIAVHTTNLL